jgi:hypothetical protein
MDAIAQLPKRRTIANRYSLNKVENMADNIVRFDGNDGIEILINTASGESFASISGYARMSGRNKSTIQRRLKTVALEHQKTAEVETQSGLKTVALISEDLIASWIIKDNPERAFVLLKAGVRVCLHEMAGYQVKSTAVIANRDPRLVLLDQLSQLTHQQIALEQRQKELDLENQRIRLEQHQLKAEQNIHAETIAQHDAELGRIFEPDGALISLAGCLNLHGKHASAAQLASVGKTAAKVYREKYGKEPERVGDARYGTVGVYPQAIAIQALKDHGYLG